MKSRPPAPIATPGPRPLRLAPALMLALTLVAGRARAQEIPDPGPPDVAPSEELRIQGPLLSARSPSQTPAPPPPATPGPFGGEAIGPASTPLSDSIGDGPELVGREPLLAVPPSLPPLPTAPAGEGLLPESAYGPRRSTVIRQPRGAFGQATDDFGRWFCNTILWGDEPWEYLTLPSSLLWKPPLANQREPRFYGKFTNLNHKNYIDTAIGAEFGLGRIAPKGHPDEGFQLDVFGAVFTRFDPKRFLTAADYRAGIPITYKKGPWSTKVSYEHTSTHIGDEYSQAYGRKQVPLVLDEIVIGVSRSYGEHVRLYGQGGYAFNTAKETNANRRARYDLGISYSNYKDTGPAGRPFAAYDMDLREYENYTVNSTLQVGWQWVNNTRSVRLALEVYQGRSQFGQFYLNTEHYAGIGGYFDW